MFLSIVVPAYNEERRLKPSLEIILKHFEKQTFKSEIIIVNDGSTDKTSDIIKEFNKSHKDGKVSIVPLGYEINKGKGYATKIGALAARGKYIYLCDSDLSTPIEEINKFLDYKDEYDIVIGSRAMAKSKVKTSFVRKALGRIGNLLIGVVLVKGVKDTQAGFKLFNQKIKKLFEKQKITRWGFDFELLYLAQKAGYSIIEIPVQWDNKKFSKLKPIHYITTLAELIKIKFYKYRLDDISPEN